MGVRWWQTLAAHKFLAAPVVSQHEDEAEREIICFLDVRDILLNYLKRGATTLLLLTCITPTPFPLPPGSLQSTIPPSLPTSRQRCPPTLCYLQ